MKDIKRKESVLGLINEYSNIFKTLIVIMELIVLAIPSVMISAAILKNEKAEDELIYLMKLIFFTPIVMFGIAISLILLYTLFLAIRTGYSYIHMFFTYSYLPLTKEEVKTLELDKDPVKFLEKICNMMTYQNFLEAGTLHKKCIYKKDTEDALTRLFYELFFTPDETYARPAIITGLTKDIASEMEDDLFLVGICKGFTCYLHTIIHGDIEVSPILDAAVPEDMTCEEEEVYAILRTERHFYIITKNNYHCKANKKNLSIAEYVEKHKSKETIKEIETSEE